MGVLRMRLRWKEDDVKLLVVVLEGLVDVVLVVEDGLTRWKWWACC